MADDRFEELYQDYISLTPEERLDNARRAYFTLGSELQARGHSKVEIIEYFLGLVGVLCCVDGVPSRKEHALFTDITKSNMTYEQFLHLIQGSKGEEIVEGARRFLASLSNEGKDAAIVLCLCFLSADGAVDVYEKALFEKLIA